ncbi:MAG: hypothetical protein QW228_08580 [Candidatus Aenigmatarchaeota archaeon]
MSDWMDIEEVEPFKPILVSWGNRVRNNLYWLKNFAEKAFLVDGTRTMQGDIIPALDATYNLGSSQAQWKYLYVAGSVGEGGIKTSNTATCVNLNADMVDGRHAGNSANQVAVSNGALCENLNADMLDGIHSDNLALSFKASAYNSPSVTWVVPGNLYGRIRMVYIGGSVVQNTSANYVNFRLHFHNSNTGITYIYNYRKPTVQIRLHAYSVTFVHDLVWKKYPLIIVMYRDTSGSYEAFIAMPELSSPPMELSKVDIISEDGYLSGNLTILVFV